jgi:hypothetical protein
MRDTEPGTAGILRNLGDSSEPAVAALRDVALAEIRALAGQRRRMQNAQFKLYMAEISAHRASYEQEKINQRVGLWIGGIVELSGLVVAYKLIVVGQPLFGGWIAGIGLILLVGMIAFGHRAGTRRRREAESRVQLGERDATKLVSREPMVAALPQGAAAAYDSSEVDLEEHAFAELVRVVHERDLATMLVKAAGFPMTRIPEFTTPLAFWTKVVQGARDGVLPGGIRPLIKKAAVLFPNNEIFVSYADPDG